MNSITQHGWQRIFWVYFAILVAIMVGAYARLVPVQIAAFPLYDKIGHVVLLGTASYLGHRATGRRFFAVGPWQLPLAPVIVALVSFAEECMQSFSPYRTFSMLDYACDIVGIGLFLWLDWVQARHQP